MSIANLFSLGRQSNTNLHANSVVLAQLSTAERNALPATDGTVSYDTQSDKLYVRANGSWEQVQSSSGGSSTIALFGPTIDSTIPNNLNLNSLGNGVTTAIASGITIDPNGYAIIPTTGYYKIYIQATLSPAVVLSSGSVEISIADDTGTTSYFKSVMTGFSGATSSLTSWTMSTQGIVQLTAGSRITMYVLNVGTGGNLTIKAMGTGPRVSYIMIEQL